MQFLAGAAGVALLVVILWDGFETMLLPRRVTRKFRLTSTFYWLSWILWSGTFRHFSNRKRREQALSAFGPLSMVVLLILWASSLIAGWALIHWGRQSPMVEQENLHTDLTTYLYMSGTTFFTLGLGDIVPRDTTSRILTTIEAGSGFGFLAIVIGYMPVLYGAFSQREVIISLLDARAGTPSCATELLCRFARGKGLNDLDPLFAQWERWCSELLQSLISYPVLSYYRSQHDNQSWLGALTIILDTCALSLAGAGNGPTWQSQLTFAMARHAVVDLAQILHAPPSQAGLTRLPPADLETLLRNLQEAGVPVSPGEPFLSRLAELRRMYEPYVTALGARLLLATPDWLRRADTPDNWQASAWERRVSGFPRAGIFSTVEDDHE